LRHWGPRTLDLDLLLYGELTLHQPRLTVPHGQMHARAFVLVPLVEVATALQHPITLHQQPLNHWLTAVNMSDIRHLNDTGVTATATI
ncbi:MAG TPA: 2-amino-4-hydroxy-6-hydroxymethyldihydropteridine diphosphokinase, partial [Halomonas sp.]|nr:2-amino-4-hydroxy-6-hydroxymethyldihydropteridine diphosphokinase [Halomonas sp.]